MIKTIKSFLTSNLPEFDGDIYIGYNDFDQLYNDLYNKEDIIKLNKIKDFKTIKKMYYDLESYTFGDIDPHNIMQLNSCIIR